MAETNLMPTRASAGDPHWFLDGACRGSILPADAWFPHHPQEMSAKDARRVCNTLCPVRERCLSEASKFSDTKGIWGGLDERDRQRLGRRERKLRA